MERELTKMEYEASKKYLNSNNGLYIVAENFEIEIFDEEDYELSMRANAIVEHVTLMNEKAVNYFIN